MKSVFVILAISMTSTLFARDTKDYSYLSVADLAVISFEPVSPRYRILEVVDDNLIVDTNPRPKPVFSINLPKKPVPKVIEPGEKIDDRYTFVSGKRIRESRLSQTTGIIEKVKKDKIRVLDKKSGGIIQVDMTPLPSEPDTWPGTVSLRKPDGGVVIFVSTGQTVHFSEGECTLEKVVHRSNAVFKFTSGQSITVRYHTGK